MNEKLKLGILGCGNFSAGFVELFQKHPFVEKVCVADINLEAAKDFGEKFKVDFYNSFDELLNSDINAVAIFTHLMIP